ncbi:ADP-ribosylglycohydrolase family protein [Modicisalibacter xianhensis]|uniref:ADP-ribosylglycohydrolase n=1 Tax=Modicisalibacter xianhensis TaxID=442341 RepID=A0A1I2ZK20_9GAMM|nr:ADP-ribosylglycohydrolase family protein [Halomonas xianhensis]SFH38158.1 ADP-ribosylglycohydrolase [Halomonas xianhensis]
MINERNVDETRGRFRGCLLGGAVGDALGASVEFLSRAEILERFGSEGITDYAPIYGGLGRITDDTQMTLFTADGLLRSWVRGCIRGITAYPGITAHAYLRWLHTQGESSVLQFPEADPGWLDGQHELQHRRAPGNTCLAALREMPALGEPARNNSKGCGGVMRVAPVGLFGWHFRQDQAPEDVFRLGAELAALTHGHPAGQLTAGALAVLVLSLTEGATLTEALEVAKACLRQEPRHEETLRAIVQAETLAGTRTPHAEAIAQLGQGWIAEEALAIALYCALVAESFQEGIILAVNHDGDSDSTGAMAGNLLGAWLGERSIPARWLEPLELRDVIAEVAEDLLSFPNWDIDDAVSNEAEYERIWRKYPGF